MKKKLSLSLISLLLLGFFMFSCNKEKNEDSKAQGQVEFAFSGNALKSSLKSANNTDTISGLTWVVYTIEDASGNVVKNSEKVDLYNMNGDYISKPISLVKGNYKLTRFLVLDWKNNIVFASPVKGSPKAYLVQMPLSISFNIQVNEVTKLTPEVLSTVESKPEDFGYVTFGFDVVNTFDFLIGTFIYNETVKNFELTTAAISILSDSTVIYNGQLKAKQNDSSSIVSVYDSIGVTNKITLPERYNNYTLVISKQGYKTYSQTFTKDELKLHLRSVDKGPLVVILEKLNLADGLVAYYKFNGDVLDYSGNNNNGTYYGRGYYTSGRLADSTAALNLNGSTDYVVVKNSPSLTFSNQVSLCGWYKTTPFLGVGANQLVCKAYSKNANAYGLAVTGNQYPNNTSGFAFGMTTENLAIGLHTTGYGSSGIYEYNYNYFTYELDKWYFIVGTYDGTIMKLYVNGKLIAWKLMTGNIKETSNDIYIGKFQFYNGLNGFLPGNIDEVRIYNRALTQDEIVSLYQQ